MKRVEWPQVLRLDSVLLLLILGMIATQFAYLRFPSIGIDDANIFLTYGRNIWLGHGYVYTPGLERVEGGTSLLFTLVCAGAHATPRPELLLAGFGILCAVLIVWSLERILRHPAFGGGDGLPLRRLLYATWLALTPGAVFWLVLPLMDTGLWVALVILSVTALLTLHDGQTRQYLGLATPLTVLMVLTRPEAILVIPGLLAAAFWLAKSAGRTLTKAIEVVLPVLAAYLATVLGVTLFRVAYFGFPFPNTYYAKVGAHPAYNLWQGLHYLLDSASVVPLTFLAVLGNLMVLWRVVRSRADREATPDGSARSEAHEDRLVWVMSALCMLLWVLPALSGGDHFALGRFLVAPMLLLPLPLLAATETRLRRRGAPRVVRLGGKLLFVLTAIGMSLFLFRFLQAGQNVAMEFDLAEDGRRLGHAVNVAFERGPLPSVGVYVTGGFGYEYHGPTLDLLGLNNVAIAHASSERKGWKNHSSFDRQQFYALSPDLAFPALTADASEVMSQSSEAQFFDLVTKGIARERRFRTLYEEVFLGAASGQTWLEDPQFFAPSLLTAARALRTRRSPPAGKQPVLIRAFVRRDWLPRLPGYGIRVVPPAPAPGR